jgi:hypothetical protein
MALKVIGAGLGRTGTLSLKLALQELGFGPCYHMMEVFEAHEQRVPQWTAIANGETPDWNTLFDGFAATVDWPACNYYRALMRKYPDAKVILSHRPAEKWFASTQATIFRDAPAGARPPFITKIVGDIIGPDWHDEKAVIAAYERHNAEVRESVPKNKLLEFQAADGWAPLCAFLGVPAPDTPYPLVNSTEDWLAGRAFASARRK